MLKAMGVPDSLVEFSPFFWFQGMPCAFIKPHRSAKLPLRLQLIFHYQKHEWHQYPQKLHG